MAREHAHRSRQKSGHGTKARHGKIVGYFFSVGHRHLMNEYDRRADGSLRRIRR